MAFEGGVQGGLLLHVLQRGMSKGMVFVPIWFEIGYSSRVKDGICLAVISWVNS